MGERNRDRQLTDARVANLGAVRRLNLALQRFDDSDVPMNPGPGREPYPWTAEHVRILTAVAVGFREVIQTRRTWDQLRREWRAPH